MLNPTTNRTTNPRKEAKALKTELTKIIAEFSDRTNYKVIKIAMFSRSERVNINGRSFDQLTDAELKTLVVQSQDGTRVEV
jgi:hypothetical protein